MWLRTPALLLAAALCCGGLGLAVLIILAVPLGIGGAGFGYRKLLVLLIGLECCGAGLLLWRRIRAVR
jgi:hypothetical protein